MGLFSNTLKNLNTNKQIQIFHSFIKCDKSFLWAKEDLCLGINGVCVPFDRFIYQTDINCNYIGIFINQTSYATAVLLGCIKSEKPFICLDVEAGYDLNKCAVEKLGITAVFTLSQDSERLIKTLKSPLLFEEFILWDKKLQIWITGEGYQTEPIQQNILYAVLTSGSTGHPKIVQVPEQAILPNITDLSSKWSVTDKDVILLASPPTFDPFFVELFLALTTGATLLTVPTEVKANSSCFLDAVFPAHCPSLVTVAQLTPSLFMRWTADEIRTRVLTANTSLRVLALGGEMFPPAEFWQRCRAHDNKTTIYSLYGTTELSCWAMLGEQDDDLGSVLSETLLKVSSDSNNDTGELLIGSDSRVCLVGEEKWKDLKPPVFRATGDIVSVKNGKYQYIGRKDNVVKRWGHRVSLEQVEHVALGCPAVSAACCVLQGACLCLFITLHSTSPTQDSVQERIKSRLLASLNKASMPDMIIQQDSLPLSKHGKINRNKLKQLLREYNDENLTCKSQKEIFRILWKKYTASSNESVGFLNAGGNSLTAMMITNKMSELGRGLATSVLSEMLNNRSLSQCCDLIIEQSRTIQNEQVALDRETSSESSEPVTKKLKASFESEILFVQMKGCASHFNFIANKADELKLQVKWFNNLQKCVDATATCIEYKCGKCMVMIGSHSGKLVALDLGSGSVLWDVQLPDRIESSLSPSSCGTSALIGCYDGLVYCLKLKCGTIAWRFKTQAMVKCIPVQVADTWIFGSYDYNVYCLKTLDGELVWKHKMDGIVLAAPLVIPEHDLVVIACLTGQVTALNCSTGSVQWLCSLRTPVFSSPSTAVGLALVAQVSGSLHALHPLTGKQVWQYQAGGKIFSSLSVKEDVVTFGCHDNHVYNLRCSQVGVALLWRLDTGSAVYATPCWVTPQHISVASTAGLIFLLDSASGSVLSKHPLPGPVFSSPVAIKQSLVIGCRDDHVYCLKYLES